MLKLTVNQSHEGLPSVLREDATGEEITRVDVVEEITREAVVEEITRKAIIEETPRIHVVEEITREAIIEETPLVDVEEITREAIIEETPQVDVVEEITREAIIEETPRKAVVQETSRADVDITREAAVEETPRIGNVEEGVREDETADEILNADRALEEGEKSASSSHQVPANAESDLRGKVRKLSELQMSTFASTSKFFTETATEAKDSLVEEEMAEMPNMINAQDEII